jgi:hypothetical protein
MIRVLAFIRTLKKMHYVFDAFSRAYDTRFLVSRRPESRDEMMAAWCGLVASTDTGEVLPDMADATSETLHLSSGMLLIRSIPPINAPTTTHG